MEYGNYGMKPFEMEMVTKLADANLDKVKADLAKALKKAKGVLKSQKTSVEKIKALEAQREGFQDRIATLKEEVSSLKIEMTDAIQAGDKIDKFIDSIKNKETEAEGLEMICSEIDNKIPAMELSVETANKALREKLFQIIEEEKAVYRSKMHDKLREIEAGVLTFERAAAEIVNENIGEVPDFSPLRFTFQIRHSPILEKKASVHV